ncbi:MAG: alpha/beta fold hydrolase [Alphaproteobacteria bacterium]|nr:alpha/beta fold hydrolase [Alphaproteobacteria bacterium]
MALLPILAAAAVAAAPAPAAPVEAPGPLAPLKGSYLAPAGKPAAVVVIVPGSGPTDRDGNNPMGVAAAPYRLLAEGLAEKQVATLRIDKRGMFASRAAVADANAVTIADYVADVRAWVKVARARSGLRCAWLLGHSEGGLVALAAAQQPEGICGIVLVSSPGRPVGVLLREQLKANPANAPLLDQAMAAIEALEVGKKVEATTLHPPLRALFAPQVQGYLIDLMRYDPAKLAAGVRVPVLIVQGERDLQVSAADARALAAADPRAKLAFVPGANHVLKAVAGDDRAANFATYANPALPLATGIVEPIADFVTRPPRPR